MSIFSRLMNNVPRRSNSGSSLTVPMAPSAPSSQPVSAPATMAIRMGRTGAGFESVPAVPMSVYSKTPGFLTILALRLASLMYAATVALRRTLLTASRSAAAPAADWRWCPPTRVRVTTNTAVEPSSSDAALMTGFAVRARRFENRGAQRRRNRRIAAAHEARGLGGHVPALRQRVEFVAGRRAWRAPLRPPPWRPRRRVPA